MSFLRLMLQAGARHRWRSWLALAMLVALVVGLVLAGASTARRTATAFPRFEAAHGYDAFFYSLQPGAPGRVPAGGRVGDAAPAPAVGAPTCACRPINGNDFSIDEVPPARLTTVVKLVSGRLPDQSDPDQVLASYNLEPFGVHLGSVLRVPLAASSQRAAVDEQRQPDPHGSDRHPARGRLLGLRVRVPDDVEPARPTTSTPRAASAGSTTRGPSCSTSTCSACATAPPASPASRPRCRPGGPLRHRPRRTGQLDRHLHRPPGGRVVDPHRPGRPGRHPRPGPGAGSPDRSGGRGLPRPGRARRHPAPAVHAHHGPHAGGRPRRSCRRRAPGGVALLLRPRRRGETRRPDAGLRLRRPAVGRRCRGGGRRPCWRWVCGPRSVRHTGLAATTTTRSCGRRASSRS